MKYYPIADRLTEFDMLSLGLGPKDVTLTGFFYGKVLNHEDDIYVMVKKQLASYRSDKHYKFRSPLAGEWFLSGANQQGYRAINDSCLKFYIVELVLVKTITITTEVEVIL